MRVTEAASMADTRARAYTHTGFRDEGGGTTSARARPWVWVIGQEERNESCTYALADNTRPNIMFELKFNKTKNIALKT